MANMKLDLAGIRRLLQTQPEAKSRLLDAAAEAIVTDIKTSFGTSPAGKNYRRGKKMHIASQEGYPPNVDLGTLRASIRAVKKGDDVRWIEDGVEYGVYLENGTPRMKPRPFMAPAFLRMQREFPELAKRILRIENR
jgi:hypothetical protein